MGSGEGAGVAVDPQKAKKQEWCDKARLLIGAKGVMGKKSARSLDEIEALLAGCEVFRTDGALPDEIAAIHSQLETRRAVGRLTKSHADFEKSGVWNTQGSIKIKRPDGGFFEDGQSRGLPETSAAQIAQFCALVEKEATRSEAFADLLKVVTGSEKQIDMFIAENSCGFCDDPNTLTVDMADFASLPDEPVEREFDTPSGVVVRRVGPTKGEILMHVLEERLYMFQGGLPADRKVADEGKPEPYEVAHFECLKPGSYQNRYRREMGIEESCIDLDCHSHHGHDDFVAVDSGGVSSTVGNINVHKASNPAANAGWERPKADDMAFALDDDFSGSVDGRIEKQAGYILDRVGQSESLAEQNQFGTVFARKNKEFEGLAHWMNIKVGGDAQELEKLKGAFNKRVLAWPAECKKEQEKKNGRAKGVLANDPTPASAALVLARRDRPDRVNDPSEKSKQFEHVNCALTTLGALGGKTATGAAQAVLEQYLPREEAAKHSWVQDPTLFWRAENGVVDFEANKFGTTPGMPESESTEEVGDAQFRGIRKMVAAIAKQKSSRKGAEEIEVIQDGWPDEDGLMPLPDMLRKMGRYRDGTQFQCFLFGKLQHWIYAEKYNGEVVFTDYQCNPPAAYAGGDGPHHPVSGVPDAFEAGMYIALKPKGGEQPAELKTSTDWPQPGSDESDAIEDHVKQISAAGHDAEKLLGYCERNAAYLGCDAAGVTRAALALAAVVENDRAKPTALDDLARELGSIGNGQLRRAIHGHLVRAVEAGARAKRVAERAAQEEAEKRQREEEQAREKRRGEFWKEKLGDDVDKTIAAILQAEDEMLPEGDRRSIQRLGEAVDGHREALLATKAPSEAFAARRKEITTAVERASSEATALAEQRNEKRAAEEANEDLQVLEEKENEAVTRLKEACAASRSALALGKNTHAEGQQADQKLSAARATIAGIKGAVSLAPLRVWLQNRVLATTDTEKDWSDHRQDFETFLDRTEGRIGELEAAAEPPVKSAPPPPPPGM